MRAETVLRFSLQANSFFTGIAGIIFTFGALPVAILIGLHSPGSAILAGMLLVAASVFFALVSGREAVRRPLALLGVALDGVIGGAAAQGLFSGTLSLTVFGWWFLAAILGLSLLFIFLNSLAILFHG